MEVLHPRAQPKGAVLVIHSWWGLTDSFRTYGSCLANAGYLVGLADLFDGQTAKTEEHARALRARPRRVPMYKTLAADLVSLREFAGSHPVRIGTVGFSMGGHWAVWLSQRRDYDLAATVLYYAARAGRFAECRAGIQAHFAQDDPWVSAQARRNMERAIHRAGCVYQRFDYPRARHWFAESDRPLEYNKKASRLALERDLRLFAAHLEA